MSIDTKPDHIGGYDHTDGNVQQVEETACKNEDIKRLLNNIERLSPVEQAAIKAIFFGDLGYEKAAEQLNMQIGTLWSHVSRAKDKLRKMMESTE
jgi:RNA polymerase sigma factor (sigma-70 family)